MGGESIYYGLNALSNNLIMADRKKLKNPNGLILGTPGSGKSFAAKREIGMGKVGQPLRIAVTGSAMSPGIGDTMMLVGRERTLKRIENAIEHFSA